MDRLVGVVGGGEGHRRRNLWGRVFCLGGMGLVDGCFGSQCVRYSLAKDMYI